MHYGLRNQSIKKYANVYLVHSIDMHIIGHRQTHNNEFCLQRDTGYSKFVRYYNL